MRIFVAAKRPGVSPRRTFGRPTREDEKYVSPTLGTLRIPPFYGVELHPSVFASGGLVANASAQVINQRAAPIPGLYAAGNNAVHTEYGVGYQPDSRSAPA
jgi:predicted oxidoreductase